MSCIYSYHQQRVWYVKSFKIGRFTLHKARLLKYVGYVRALLVSRNPGSRLSLAGGRLRTYSVPAEPDRRSFLLSKCLFSMIRCYCYRSAFLHATIVSPSLSFSHTNPSRPPPLGLHQIRSLVANKAKYSESTELFLEKSCIVLFGNAFSPLSHAIPPPRALR